MTRRPAVPASSGIRTVAILMAVIAVLFLAREILIPLSYAITVALILTPAVALLQKLRFGRVPAVAVVMLVAIAAAGAAGWMLFDQLVSVANELPLYQQNIHRKLEALRRPGKGAFGRATASVKELGKELAGPEAAPVPPPVASGSTDRAARRGPPNPTGGPLPVKVVAEPANELAYVRQMAQPFLGPLATFAIVLVFSIFLLIKHDDLRNRLFRLVGLDRLNVMTQALDDATRRVSRYLVAQFLVNAAFGVLCGIGLYFIGVPYAALWGAVAAILRIVPYAGAVVSALLPFTLALAVFDSWSRPLFVFLLFGSLELVTGNLIEPWLYGAHTGISALALLVSTVFWTALWGPAGLILSTPLTVCVVVLGRYVPQFAFLHVILGDEAVLNAEARIYQRLLAMDEHEARAVAELYLAESSLTQLYDSVIVPALTLAERDRHKGALDDTRQEFVFLSIKEMMIEFSEQAAKADPSEFPPPAGRIFALPASDEADEMIAAMLTQLLEQAGCIAIPLPAGPSLYDSMEALRPDENDTFCISALPPFAFSCAIALARRLQLRYPRTRLLIGVWGFTGDAERARQRFQPSSPAALVASLAEAVLFIQGEARLGAAPSV
jgi:predicted PurR-regulated permease PerM